MASTYLGAFYRNNDVSALPRRSASGSILKRIFDLTCASALIVALLPLFVLIALSVAVLGRGNPIFAHKRIGRNGRAFYCLKFRTMVVNAEGVLKRILSEDPKLAREWEVSRKLRHDPRIIPVIGHLLRRSSLDELPQLFNVILGDMSLVGPRPIVADELKKYGPGEALYLAVRPGLTGPWQIGSRSDDTYENRVKLDINYVQNLSLIGDITILAKTAKIVASGRAPGAY